MSKKHILRVPAEPPDSFGKDNPYPEFVSQGNFEATLTPGEKVETKDAKFASWLMSEYGLTDETPEPDPEPVDDGYPENFPRRAVFIDQGISIETLRGMTREQLIAISGVGESTADAIIEYFGGAQ